MKIPTSKGFSRENWGILGCPRGGKGIDGRIMNVLHLFFQRNYGMLVYFFNNNSG